MSKYQSNITLDNAAKILKDVDGEIAVLTHAKPDGDAFGAVVAMVAALRKLGKCAQGYLVPPVPANFQQLQGYDLVTVLDDAESLKNKSFYLLVDTGAKAQVGLADEILKQNSSNLMIVDHHLSGDVESQWLFVDSDAGAVCEIIWDLVDCLCVETEASDEYDPIIREAIFVGIVSDTGWFRFSNTRPVTHQLAAKLIEYGVDHSHLYQLLEQQERPEKLKLLMRAVGSLELLADQKIAIMKLTISDFEETGAYEEETERIVDIPQKVSTVELVVLISEKLIQNDGETKTICRMSFRSKPSDNPIDVAKVASYFGGGGHARAAGAKVVGTISENIEVVRDQLQSAIAAQI